MPVLELANGDLLKESRMIADFANNLAGPSQGLQLWPHEGAKPGDFEACRQTAIHQCAMLEIDPLLLAYFKPAREKFTVYESINEFMLNFPQIESFFKKHMNGKPWLRVMAMAFLLRIRAADAQRRAVDPVSSHLT